MMSIIITPVGDTEFLAISGDIERTLAIPAHPDDDDYVISLSDGTLLAGNLAGRADTVNLKNVLGQIEADLLISMRGDSLIGFA